MKVSDHYQLTAPGGPYPGKLINRRFPDLAKGKDDKRKAFYLTKKDESGIGIVEAPVSDILKAIKDDYGLSMAEICRKAGLDESTVWRWEKQNRNPSLPSLARIVAVLEQCITNEDTSKAIRITDKDKLMEIYLRALAMLGVECDGHAGAVYMRESALRGGWGLELTAAVAVSLCMPSDVSQGFRVVYCNTECIAIQPINAPTSKEAVEYCAEQYKGWATAYL